MRFLKISGCYILALIFLSVFASVYCCEIGMALPWETVTSIPGDSSVQINCTVNGTNEEIAWSIRLTNSTSDRRFINEHSKLLLNRRGFFQLTEINTEINKTIRLLVNSTEGNNGTLVRCFYPGRATLVSETTLFVHEILPIGLKKHDLDLSITNISWNSVQLIPGAVLNFYTFSVASTSSFIVPFQLQLQDTNIVFTAPEGAPPCEVYNFSVTATYDIIGATNTVNGCSISSPVLSTMLPTLPEIDDLESTLIYSLEKTLNRVILRINFLPAGYCKLYPVLKYILEIRGSTLHNIEVIQLGKPSISVDNLPEDEILVFSISALNSFGSISSNESTIYTTDVQLVRMTLLIDTDVIKIQCDFIPGSNAQGCMVVMVGETSNTTKKLMRRNTHTAVTCLTSLPSKNYKHVVAFDIESDGSIGTVDVPGYFEKAGADHASACNEKSGVVKAVLPAEGIKVITLVVVMVFSASTV